MLPVFILRIGPFVPDTPTYRKSSDGWRLNPTPRESHPSEDLSELPPLVTTDHVPNPASTLNIMARQAYHCAHSRSWRCTDPLCTCSWQKSLVRFPWMSRRISCIAPASRGGYGNVSDEWYEHVKVPAWSKSEATSEGDLGPLYLLPHLHAIL